MKTPISKTSSKSDYIVKLERLDLFKPGAIIDKEKVEFILGMKYTSNDDWNWLGKYLTLTTLIKASGYFVSQAGLEAPAFKILATEEMADHGAKQLANAMGKIYQTGLIMSAHKHTHKLSEESQKKYEGVRKNAATAAIAMQKILMDDMFFS